MRALRQALGEGVRVREVDAATLLNTPWEVDTHLLVMPGGRDLPYLEKLGKVGAARIRHFVEAGGSYLGLCAGGYFGAADIAFFVGDSAMAIAGARPLKFFAGRCVGPVWRDFVYNSEAGAHAATVHPTGALAARTGGAFVLYQNGGGAFEDAWQHPNTEVLLRYAEDGQDKAAAGTPPGPDGQGPKTGADKARGQAAAVLCHVGAGRAVLTGVHPEFDPTLLSEQVPAAARAALLAAGAQRCETWAYLLQQLALPARCVR